MRKSIVTLMTIGVLAASVMVFAKADVEPFRIHEFGTAKIYRVPFYAGVQTDTLRLFEHPLPLKRQSGWTIAYLDIGFKLSNPIYVEEIPAGHPEVLAERIQAEITFIVVSGEGVSVHRNPKGEQTASAIREGDIFFVPYGHWIGFGNPAAMPLRILATGTAIVPAILDQDIEMVDEEGLRTKVPFVVEYLKLLEASDAVSFGNVKGHTEGTRRPAAKKKADFTVYEPTWGMPVSTVRTEAPPHHFPKRRAEGWRDAHIETGGRIQNNFIIQEAAPSFKEIGHRHGGGALFYGLRGEGYMAFRAEEDAPERRLFWRERTLFVLPPLAPPGLWHAHANTSQQHNRLLAYTFFLDRRIVDPYTGRTSREYTTGEDRDGVWDALKKTGTKRP